MTAVYSYYRHFRSPAIADPLQHENPSNAWLLRSRIPTVIADIRGIPFQVAPYLGFDEALPPAIVERELTIVVEEDYCYFMAVIVRFPPFDLLPYDAHLTLTKG